jgi:hypothetical protein
LEENVYEQEMIDKIASTIVERRLSVPAVLFMEVLKPLNFFGAQTLNFFGPLIESFLKKGNRYYDFTAFLEKRENIEAILRRVEEMEDARPHNKRPKRGRRQKKIEASYNESGGLNDR